MTKMALRNVDRNFSWSFLETFFAYVPYFRRKAKFFKIFIHFGAG